MIFKSIEIINTSSKMLSLTIFFQSPHLTSSTSICISPRFYVSSRYIILAQKKNPWLNPNPCTMRVILNRYNWYKMWRYQSFRSTLINQYYLENTTVELKVSLLYKVNFGKPLGNWPQKIVRRRKISLPKNIQREYKTPAVFKWKWFRGNHLMLPRWLGEVNVKQRNSFS